MAEALPQLSPYGTRANPVQIGDRHGRWTVIAEAPQAVNSAGYKTRRVLCRCDCGVEKVQAPNTLRYGSTRSCGCLQREAASKSRRKHGATANGRRPPREYMIWLNMRSRCRNPANKGFAYYGGRGIEICDRWFDSFEAFMADIGPRPSHNHSVERKDNDGPYSPDNCKWASKKEQARNTRRSRIIWVRGEPRVLAEIAETTGICEATIRERVERGWHHSIIDQPRLSPWEAAHRAGTARWAKARAAT